MALETGIYHSLRVARQVDFGYFLTDEYEDVLLHESALAGETPIVGEMITVFLYNDHKGRAAATLERPFLEFDDYALLEVMDYSPRMGFFLENGISKQLLLPIDQLPTDRDRWPRSNERYRVLAKMTFDKQGRMLAALVSEESEIDEFLAKRETIELPDSRKDFYNGVVIKLMSIGVMVYLPDYNQLGFLHISEQTHIPRLGEKISVRVSYTREDGRINLSMKQVREVSRLEDADLILNFLQERGGAMPYSDNTSPEIIKQKFKLSKAAFKRALGKLMSERVIYQQDGWTYMTDRNSTDRN